MCPTAFSTSIGSYAPLLEQPGATRLRRLVAVNATFDKLQAAVTAVAAAANSAEREASDDVNSGDAGDGNMSINESSGSNGGDGALSSLVVDGSADTAITDDAVPPAASPVHGSPAEIASTVRELVAMAARFGKFEIVEV